jgi:UrcA family protein
MNTLNTSTLSSLISAAIFGLLTLGGSAMSVAADASDPPQVTVKFEDLNLSNARGAETLYRRISVAAVTVCRPQAATSLASKSLMQSCVHHAIADAVGKVGRAELFAVYYSKGHEQRPIVLAQSR